MRKFIITIVVIIAIAAAIGAYLVSTTPSHGRGVKFPLSASDRALLAQVPEGAETFALIPTAAALEPRLDANPVTRDLLARVTQKQPLPLAWMMGGADVVAWSINGHTTYLVHLDPLRAAIARAWLLALGGTGGSFLINAPAVQPIDSGELDRIVSIAANLPAGDALVVQRTSARGSFPPIPRPAVSSVHVDANEILITSRATADPQDIAGDALHVRFPRTALLTTAFAKPPRALELHRVFGKQVSTLLESGGTIAIYAIDTGTLLPKPREVIAIPATPERRQALRDLMDMVGKTGQELTGIRLVDSGSELEVSFDEDSMQHYLKDGTDEPRWPANVWAAKVDPGRMVPLLNEIDGNVGLRIVAPRLHRSIRDLKHWISSLERAKSIEAAAFTDGQHEELRVAIVAK